MSVGGMSPQSHRGGGDAPVDQLGGGGDLDAARVRHRRRELISSVVCHSVIDPARPMMLLEPSSDGLQKVAGGAEGPDGGRSSRARSHLRHG